jgi:hypothetical protein
MTADNTVSRSLHDLGLATWFGGSLMGAVGLNGAAADVEEPKQRLRVAGAVLVLNARMGEQQRAAKVTGGLLGRLRLGRAA